MKDFLYKSVIFLCLVSTGQYSTSQGIVTNLVFDQISKEQGLPDNAINFIYQDSRGFLWLSTSHGLSRYDGRSFKNYTTLGKNDISDMAVNSITEDKEGNIWFGTESGLNKLNPFTETIIQYHEGSGPGTIPYKWCNYLYTDLDKNLWLSTEKGLALYNSSNNSFQNYPVSVFGKDERINKFINKILDDSAGKLWLSTSYGVKLFDKKTGSYSSYFSEKINIQVQREDIFLSIFKDHQGTVWAGTFNAGLFKFNKTAGAFEKINIAGINKYKFNINDISEIKMQDGWYLLLSTDGGLVSIKSENKESLASSYSLSGYSLGKIFTDRQQNLWVSAKEGLFKLNQNSFAFKWLPVIQGGKETTTVFHIIPDIKNPETIFYLTTQNGWFTYNAVTQIIVPFSLPIDKNQLLKNINDWSSDGRGYWFTSVKGFGYYDIYNNRLSDLSKLAVSSFGQNTTGHIIKAGEDNYWVTLKRSGILVYNSFTQKDTVIFGDKNKPDNTYGNSIYDIQKGNDGNIWFAGRNKLYRVNPKDFSYKTFLTPQSDEKVDETKTSPLHIVFTKSGRLIVCSHLRIYEFKDDQLKTVYPVKGFSSFSIEEIAEDAANNLWVQTSSAGVFKTDTGFLRWEAMNNLPGWEEGTTLTEINTKRPGEILFASDAKIGVLKESLLQRNAAPMPVIISRVRYGEKENYLVSLQKAVIKSSFKDAVEIELSPVNFIDEKESRILYRLSGWDDDWKELSNVSTIHYEQLPPRDYSFVTKSVNAAGLESIESKMGFTVVPPFYLSWWFIALAILLITGILYATYRYRLHKALEMEKLRTRIATDLHDDIGATLSSISFYSEAVKQKAKEKLPEVTQTLEKMGEISRTMVTGMSDIVWAINPLHDDMEKMQQRMKMHAAELCAVKNMVLHVDADTMIKNLKPGLEQRKNIYMIFKEALNNSLKYAECKNIWLSLKQINNRFVMQIRDDGKGFDTNSEQAGNGLQNMKRRAGEIGGSLVIESGTGKGTKIELMVKIT